MISKQQLSDDLIIENNNKLVQLWLLSGCFLIFSMLLIGGVTRLTNSGLSITEWNLVGGIIPPLSEGQWQEKFKIYQQFPEYQLLHSHFTLADFKFIFFWEYLHRLVGRIIGFVFIIPFIYFIHTTKFQKGFIKKVILLFFLGGLQGFLGWFMVKSGLVDQPNVSHYRLAIHLVMAFVLFSFTFWLYLELKPKTNSISNKNLSTILWIFLFFIFFQIIFGAFVAGLDAGKIYNTFPKLGNNWIPNEIGEYFNKQGFVSLFDYAVSVQFIHRYLAKILFIFFIAIYFIFIKQPISSSQKFGLNLILLIFILQILLGIFTLLYSVPLLLGVMHQLLALILVASVLFAIRGEGVDSLRVQS